LGRGLLAARYSGTMAHPLVRVGGEWIYGLLATCCMCTVLWGWGVVVVWRGGRGLLAACCMCTVLERGELHGDATRSVTDTTLRLTMYLMPSCCCCCCCCCRCRCCCCCCRCCCCRCCCCCCLLCVQACGADDELTEEDVEGGEVDSIAQRLTQLVQEVSLKSGARGRMSRGQGGSAARRTLRWTALHRDSHSWYRRRVVVLLKPGATGRFRGDGCRDFGGQDL
jgi:hypothetical protein